MDRRMLIIRPTLSRWILLLCGLLLYGDPLAGETPVRYARRFRSEDNRLLIKTASAEWCYRLVETLVRPEAGDADCMILNVPLRRIVTLSTTHIGYLSALGLLDRVVGHSGLRWLYAPAARQRAEQGAIVEVGAGGIIDVERIVALQPDAVFAYPDVDASALAELERLGVPVLMMLEYLEQTPLGRSEWIRLVGKVVGRSEEAEQQFAAVERSYNNMANLVARSIAEPSHRPTVLVGSAWAGSWAAPSGNSYIARLIADAGGRYLWEEHSVDGLLFLDLEAVYVYGSTAAFWLDTGLWRSREHIVAADSRLRRFPSLQSGRVYNNDARRTSAGGTDYYESGLLNAHYLLADLIAILHPQLLPTHNLYYYRRLP